MVEHLVGINHQHEGWVAEVGTAVKAPLKRPQFTPHESASVTLTPAVAGLHSPLCTAHFEAVARLLPTPALIEARCVTEPLVCGLELHRANQTH